MAEVIHGNAGGNQLNAVADKTQVYGLKGNDTLISDNKKDALLIGGSGDDDLIMMGGNGTLSGGKGSDVFELTYSADKPLSAVIEDFEPSSDRIIVNHVGDTAPQLTSRTLKSGDVVWKDSDGLFKLTLRSVRDNDYFDGDAPEQVWEVLELTNAERENPTTVKGHESIMPEGDLPWLTLSDGLMQGASIRAGEITEKGKQGLLTDHTRLDNETGWRTVFDEIGKQYTDADENLDGGASSAQAVMNDWIGSLAHHKNILDADNKGFSKLGVGYNYDDSDETNRRYYWTQLFAAGLESVETVSLDSLSVAQVNPVTKAVTGDAAANTLSNANYGATIDALDGNDSISNSGLIASISGGTGNDTITNSGSFVTICAGLGNDSIQLGGANNLIEYAKGDGSDTIHGFRADSTLSIAGGKYNLSIVEADAVLAVGNDSITLVNAASLSALNINAKRYELFMETEDADNLSEAVNDAIIRTFGGNDSIRNSGSNVSIDAGDGADSIRNDNKGRYSTILGGDGDDTISNSSSNSTLDGGQGNDSISSNGTNVSISAGDGDDYIKNAKQKVTITGGSGNDSITNSSLAANVSINAGADNDSIDNKGNSVTIDAGDGNDYIFNYGYNVTISGGDDDDTISNSSSNSTLDGGQGNDSIQNKGANVTIVGGLDNDWINLSSGAKANLIQYTEGDGRDTIEGFRADSTLQIGGGSGTYSTQESGSDIFVNVGAGFVLLKDAASLATRLHIAGVESEPVIMEPITLTTGNDTYSNTVESATINAGAGDDSIANSANNVAINAGLGNDSISLASDAKNVLIEYTVGDGSDVISGFHKTDKLSISHVQGVSYSTQTSGADVLVNVGEDSITLIGAASLSAVNVFVDWSGANVSGKLITLSDINDIYSNTIEGATIEALSGNDSIINNAAQVSINGGAGDDTVRNYSTGVTIKGGVGHDSIRNEGANVSISGGDDQDDFSNSGSNVTIQGGGGDDRIHNSGKENVTVIGGAGNDSIYNSSSNALINTGDGDDTVTVRSCSNITIIGGAGNDSIHNYGGSNVTISGGSGDDTIANRAANVSIDAGSDGDKRIHNNGAGDNVTIVSGAGNDSVYNRGTNVSIDTGAGNDTITIDSAKVTLNSGKGDDTISLTSRAKNVLIQYTPGGGNDTIWGLDDNSSLRIGDGTGTYSSTVRGDDVILTVGEGKITLKDFREKPAHIILGESKSDGGPSDGDNGGHSSEGNGGNDNGDTGSGGGGNISNGGNVSNVGNIGGDNTKGNISASGNINTGGSINTNDNRGGYSGGNDNASATTYSSPFDALKTTTPNVNQHVYAGGNQVIVDYQSGEKIIFGATYTGALFDDAGNLIVGSSTGALAVTNATDKVIDLLDAAGNDFLKAYAASTAGVIDGRGLAGFEVIKGSAGADIIFAGDGGSQLWGGADVASDTLVGGAGSDIFIVGKTQGSDVFLNASAADIVHLNDATLSDIIGTAESNGAIAVAFNTGNVIALQSSEPLSAAFLLADGSAYRYNHVAKTWQGA